MASGKSSDYELAEALSELERRSKIPSDMGFHSGSARLNGGSGYPLKTPWLGAYWTYRRINPGVAVDDLLVKLESLGAPAGVADKFRGSLLGLAMGDALGTTLEFSVRDRGQVEDIVGGGPFQLEKGYWTDDTSMACCLAYSLLKRGNFDPRHQMECYSYWYLYGAYSPTGRCFDIGNTVRRAITRFLASGEAFSGDSDPASAGNGSLMRLAPVVLFFYPDFERAVEFAGQSSRTTHQAPEAIDACRYFGALLHGAISGVDKSVLLDGLYSPIPGYWDAHPLQPAIERVAKGSYKHKTRSEIASDGYVVHTLEAALWAFYRCTDFRGGALEAVNLAGDADTTGAVFGQLAGAYFGETGLPIDWIIKTHAAHGFYHFADDLLLGSRLPSEGGSVEEMGEGL